MFKIMNSTMKKKTYPKYEIFVKFQVTFKCNKIYKYCLKYVVKYFSHQNRNLTFSPSLFTLS